MIKLTIPDDSKENKRRMTAASGAYGANELAKTNETRNYGKSTNVRFAITKDANNVRNITAQTSASNSNTLWTQPMFFSPLHTPQNWQIASKRREIYQWMTINSCEIITYDYTYKNISDILFMVDEVVEDIKTGGLLYENINCEPILGAIGEFRKPLHYSVRDCSNKRCFSFNPYGYWRKLEVSEEHPIIILDGKLYRHKSKLKADAKWRRSKGMKEGGNRPKVKIPKNLICRKEAQNVSKEDFLLSPLPELGEKTIENDLAWSLGLCIADGCIYKGEGYSVRFTHDRNEIYQKKLQSVLSLSFSGVIGSHSHGEGNGWRTSTSTKKSYNFFSKYITGKTRNKKFTADVFELDRESRLNILGGYFDGDGSFSKKEEKLIANNYSCDMADQIYWLLLSCGISCSLNKYPLYGEHYNTDAEWVYRIFIPSSEIPKLSPYMRNGKIPNDFKPKKSRKLRFIYEEENVKYLAQPISEIKEFNYSGKGYDIQVDPEKAFVASGFITSNCRFYYSSEPKVAAGVDFYANFSMNGFKLECKNKKVLRYYEKLIDKLDLAEKLNEISHEYFLIGDVFPFVEIQCPHCLGQNVNSSGEQCNHPDGSFRSIKIMNPDYLEVRSSPLANKPEYYLVPDEELKLIVSRRDPIKIYESLPEELRRLVSSGQPIPLSDRCVSHLKFNPSPYGTYGNPFVQRLFVYLAYKTKIMTANWIVAERMILPVRLVKVGDKDRPAIVEDIQDIANQLGAVANDPNLTIVTHHAVDVDWIGATGKIHNITPEMEQIGKEILDGLMLNQALLNGEAASYNSAQVGVEVLIRRLENWRNKLKEWVEKNIFLPIAMMQGFTDDEESKILGTTEYCYPKLKWNDLQLRDKTNKIQSLMQLNDKGLVSAQTILEELDLEYDVEVERLRDEQVMASASGMLPQGGAAGNLGTMGMGGAMGGGMPGAEGAPGGELGGGMGGDMAGGMGGDMGGGMGGAPVGGGMGMGAEALPKITKKGKEQEQPEPPAPQMIKFTKLEQKMYKLLQELNVPNLFAQYSVKVPGEQRPFRIDFAYPKLGVGIESDGSIWHQREDFVQRDLERDQKLANVGWRILRFKEAAIDEHLDTVRDVISKNILEAAKQLKKKGEEGVNIEKFASISELMKEEKLGMNIIDLPNNLGILILIGNIENE